MAFHEADQLAGEYLAAILQGADDAIITKDLNSVVTSWNPAAERTFGYTANEMIGQSILRLVPADITDEETSIISRLRKGERIYHYETRRLRKDGRTIYVSLTISPIRNSEGTIIGASKIARDITEQRLWREREARALAEARAARRQAERTSRLKDEFLATISHELRTPLTAILGWVRMLRAGSLKAKQMEQALEVIERNARSQAQLIEDLLDISRITMGKLRLDVRSIEPAQVIAAAVDALRVAAEARNIRIHTVLDSNAGPIVGDSERLQQVVWNLLSNAIKFTPKGGRVQVVLERVNSHIEIRVSDNGRGIRPEFLPYVFDRFSQAEASTTRSQGGIGMGLSIAKAIAELHGGSISAWSEGEDKGATFIVSIPVMPVRQPEAPLPRAHPAVRTGVPFECPPAIAGLKVMIVDDDRDTRDLLVTVIEQCGGIVETAADSAGALRLFRVWKPRVFVLDIGLPEVDGYELIRRIRNEESNSGPRAPAIALTAFARVEDRVRALASGFQMHVAKPVEPAELLTIIASLADLVETS